MSSPLWEEQDGSLAGWERGGHGQNTEKGFVPVLQDTDSGLCPLKCIPCHLLQDSVP